MKVALYGGSFNPIHNGHMQLANELIANKVVDQVWFIPCGNHAFDKKLIPGEHRMKMINLAIENNNLLKVIGVELDPSKKSFTSETIKWFKSEFPHDFHFVIGADNLNDLAKWHDFTYLKENVKFILVKRPGFKTENNLGLSVVKIIDMDNKISSSEIRNDLEKGISIKGFVKEEVEEYIKSKELYK